MKLVWARPAWGDRRAIRAFISSDNPIAAVALDESFAQRATSLIDHPQLGRSGRVPGTRELVVHQNYILIYDIRDNQIRILRILHAARQWPLGGPKTQAGS